MTEFEDIAQEAITRAEMVKCSQAEFTEGLQDMVLTISERWQLAKHEAQQEEEKG